MGQAASKGNKPPRWLSFFAMKKRLPEYTNSEIACLIDELIHNAKYRAILKDRFVDGLTFEKIAEKHDLSVQGTKKIVYKTEEKLVSRRK